jgi:integrase
VHARAQPLSNDLAGQVQEPVQIGRGDDHLAEFRHRTSTPPWSWFNTRKDTCPDTCICGEKHTLVFTTRTGHPNEPRNIDRAFDVRCARYGVRRIMLHDTRRTCGSLLAALDVHPRMAMAILWHSRIELTMEI